MTTEERKLKLTFDLKGDANECMCITCLIREKRADVIAETSFRFRNKWVPICQNCADSNKYCSVVENDKDLSVILYNPVILHVITNYLGQNFRR